MAENQYGFPTEVLSLPSQGLLYPEDSPLRSGTIDVKYMTAKEEDILTSTNLITQGKVIQRLLESVIVTPNVKLDDLLVGDKNAVMMGTRILGYGSNYNVAVNDPETSEEVELQVDLTTLEPKELDEKILEKGENKFEFELPNSKRKVEFKLLNGHDETKIEEALKEFNNMLDGLEQSYIDFRREQSTQFFMKIHSETLAKIFSKIGRRDLLTDLKQLDPDNNELYQIYLDKMSK